MISSHEGVYNLSSLICPLHELCVSWFMFVWNLGAHTIYAPQIVFTWKPKIATCPNGKPSSHLSGGFRLVSIVPPYFLVTLGDIPQQFLLQESPREALRRFRRFLHWACHKDRMGGQVHCICVRFFLASIFRSVRHKIYV